MRSGEHGHSTGGCDPSADVAKTRGLGVALVGLTAVLG